MHRQAHEDLIRFRKMAQQFEISYADAVGAARDTES